MGLISAKTILTSICLFHLTLGFFFLTSPVTVADQGVVQLLGEAMGLPYARSFAAPSPALGLLAAVLAAVGITDLVTLSLPEDVAMLHYWGAQAPLRVLVAMLFLFYSYLFSPASLLHAGGGAPSARLQTRPLAPPVPGAGGNANTKSAASPGDMLKNRVFFAFMFVETLSWFWVWITLREERGQVLARLAHREQRKRRSNHGAWEEPEDY